MSEPQTEIAVELARLFHLVRAGAENAAVLFLENYEKLFRQIIRVHLHRRLRSIEDSSDLLQDFWESVLVAKKHQDFPSSPVALVAYLTTTAANLVRMENRKYLKYEKRNLHKEAHFAVFPTEADLT
ncbi:MAG: hypothetical protein L0215_08005 [Gemmataceae bacterium]|nr:hypothetical protein [Gemmataceae bacterium]